MVLNTTLMVSLEGSKSYSWAFLWVVSHQHGSKRDILGFSCCCDTLLLLSKQLPDNLILLRNAITLNTCLHLVLVDWAVFRNSSLRLFYVLVGFLLLLPKLLHEPQCPAQQQSESTGPGLAILRSLR